MGCKYAEDNLLEQTVMDLFINNFSWETGLAFN